MRRMKAAACVSGKSTAWPKEMGGAEWTAFVLWWNDGVDGWGIFSGLNYAEVDEYFDCLGSAPASVLAQLKRTPALETWLNKRTSTAARTPE